MEFYEFIRELGRVGMLFESINADEPFVDETRCERHDYVRLEDLCVGDTLCVKGDDKSHPNANYLLQIVKRDGANVARLWNKGRGPYCFVVSLTTINYYDGRNKVGEFGALKVNGNSTWPYFTIRVEGLLDPTESWSDGVGEILLQRKCPAEA